MSTPTSVYKYFDADAALIYVGITSRGIQRQAEHVSHSKWWPFVRSQDVEHYDDRETAERRERQLIEKHQPPFNKTHNAEHPRRLAAYLKHAEVAAQRCGHCWGCRTNEAGLEDGEESYGCRVNEPDDYDPCEICGSRSCLYQDGLSEGRPDGYYKGREAGQDQAWEKAHALYQADFLGTRCIELVVDGKTRSTDGMVSMGAPGALEAIRDLDAAIATQGLSALVDAATRARDPWASQGAPS